MFGNPVSFLEDADLERLLFQSDPVMQQEVLAYLDHMKNNSEGWQVCICSLIKGTSQDNRFKFFCFQVIEHYAKHSYGNATIEDQVKMREFLSHWIHLQCLPGSASQATFIRNKAAQIFSLVFVQDFPQRWASFFTDLIDTLSLGLPAVDNYIRVLKAIDSEVADQELIRTMAEAQRNSLIKTAMRETAVEKLVESWYQILSMYQGRNADIVCHCLDVIGVYVSWINIVLVANDRFIQLILRLLSLTDVRESAVDCLYNIISKGMVPLEKFQLIESLFPVLDSAGIMEPVKDDESEFTCKLSRLVNGVGLNLIDAHKGLSKGGSPEQLQAVWCAIERKVPLLIRFLDNDYDDVSSAVIDFAREYIHMLKGRSLLTEEQVNSVQNILLTIARKMKFDESYRFDDQGEDEATFLEYRKLLKVLYENLAGLNKDVVLSFTEKYVSAVLTEWRTASFQEVEVAISLIYYIGEAIAPAIIGGHFINTDNSESYSEAPPMQRMMQTLVTCGVSSHPHSTVGLQYLETAVRYDKFFAVECQHLPPLLVTFLGERGLRSADCKVRSRAAFLFSRLIKSLKHQMSNYTDEVLLPLKDLLVLSNNADEAQWVSRDDQLYLYEAAALLILASSKPSQEKGLEFRKLLVPILDKFNAVVAQLRVEADPETCLRMADYLCHVMAVTSRASKAFPNHNSMKSCACVPVFIEALHVFLTCLEIPHIGLSTVQAGMRQFLHRMVVCLEEDLLPFVPQASQGLLKNSDINSIQEYLPLIIQIITKFKGGRKPVLSTSARNGSPIESQLSWVFQKEVVPFLQQVLVPIVNAILTSLAAPIEENDQQAKREKELLQRNYFYLVSAIVGNDVINILRAQDSQFLEQIMMSTIRGAVDFPDPVAQKTCFSTLRQLVSLWGEKDEPAGFTQFIYKNIVPACFLAPMKPTFDLTDAQTRVALGESAMCIKTVHHKRGDEFLNYLQNEYLPTLQVSPQCIAEYCRALKADNKVFKTYVKQFFHRAKQ